MLIRTGGDLLTGGDTANGDVLIRDFTGLARFPPQRQRLQILSVFSFPFSLLRVNDVQ